LREQSLHGEFEVGYVFVDGGLDDGMRGVKVPMSEPEPIAHAGDLRSDQPSELVFRG
jgi:hypothetical protein